MSKELGRCRSRPVPCLRQAPRRSRKPPQSPSTLKGSSSLCSSLIHVHFRSLSSRSGSLRARSTPRPPGYQQNTRPGTCILFKWWLSSYVSERQGIRNGRKCRRCRKKPTAVARQRNPDDLERREFRRPRSMVQAQELWCEHHSAAARESTHKTRN